MLEEKSRPPEFATDERLKAIPAFDPTKAKAPRNPEWGKTPYTRVDTARYTSKEHVELELERMWAHVWQPACREEEIPDAGSYMEYQIGDQSLLVTRTKTGEIKAFHNFCPHRGTQLAKGCGRVSQFVCPFHGWRWSLDGTNRYVHDRAEFPGLEDEELRLAEAQVATWGGFVFVKLDDGGPGLEEFLTPVADHLRDYRIEEYRIKSWRTVILPANWKAALEAFEESYHLMGTHPQTMKGNCDVNCDYENFGAHSMMKVPVGVPSARFNGQVSEQEVLRVAIENLLDFGLADENEKKYMEDLVTKPLPKGETTRSLFQKMSHSFYGPYLPGVSIDQYMEDWDYTIFPNLVFNLFPGTIFGFIARPNGMDPDSCIFDVIALSHPAGQEMPLAKREFITDPNYDWGVVFGQDLANMARVQQGMHQKQMKQTRLASYQEKRIINRIRHIDEYYAAYGDSE